MMSALDKWNILNEREQKIAILFVLHDLQVKEIAAKLAISQTSVKHALAIVYRIVGVTGAIRFALWLGLHIKVIDPEYKGDSL
jgi:DNA-binding CsgD family transcriptional regulator